jgi:hypothetical protein
VAAEQDIALAAAMPLLHQLPSHVHELQHVRARCAQAAVLAVALAQQKQQQQQQQPLGDGSDNNDHAAAPRSARSPPPLPPLLLGAHLDPGEVRFCESLEQSLRLVGTGSVYFAVALCLAFVSAPLVLLAVATGVCIAPIVFIAWAVRTRCGHNERFRAEDYEVVGYVELPPQLREGYNAASAAHPPVGDIPPIASWEHAARLNQQR